MKRILALLLLACLLAFNAQAQVTVSPSVTGAPPTYIEGTCTLSDGSGATLTFSASSCNFIQIGKLQIIYMQFTYPSTADVSTAQINWTGTNTVTTPNINNARQCTANATTSSTAKFFLPNVNTKNMQPLTSSLGAVTNAQMTLSVNFVVCTIPTS